MQQGSSADRAGGTQRVTQGYRPTQWIYFGGIQDSFLYYRQRLCGKSFVKLNPVDVIQLQTDLTQHTWNGFLRADTHNFRRYARHSKTEKLSYGRQVVALQRGLADQQHRARTIRHLRSVASGNRTMLRKHRFEFSQRFHRSVCTWTFVLLRHTCTHVHFAT